MVQILEMFMLIAFGIAWPTSIVKSWRARTTTGKSLLFLIIVLVGYACGITGNIVGGVNYVIVFYIINFAMVSTDLLLYFRNRRIDRAVNPLTEGGPASRPTDGKPTASRPAEEAIGEPVVGGESAANGPARETH